MVEGENVLDEVGGLEAEFLDDEGDEERLVRGRGGGLRPSIGARKRAQLTQNHWDQGLI